MTRADLEPLLDAVAQGDRAALGRILALHQDRLYNVVRRMVGNRDDAAEITQEAMLKIVEHIDRFERRSSIGTWMTRIAMNLAISHLRKRKHRQTISLEQDGPESGDASGTPLNRNLADRREPQPHQRVQERELLAHLQTALGQLDDDFRAVLVLRDIDRLDYQAIAEVLQVPVGTVKSRLFRARLALRQAMWHLCPPPTRPGEAPQTAKHG